MATPNDAYDILLNGRGYMLARDDDKGSMNLGGRMWSVEAQGYSTTQQTQEERKYGSAPPTIESAMVWRTGNVGYGEERQRIEGAYNYSQNIDARFYEQITVGPQVNTLTMDNYSSPVAGFAEFNGSLYVNNGRYLNAIGPMGLVTSKDLEDFYVGARCTDLCTFDNRLLVALGLDHPMQALDKDGNWATADGSNADTMDVKAKYLTIWQDLLYGSRSEYEVASVSSGASPLSDANWSGLLTVGERTTDITALAASHSLVYVGKQDGLHALDASLICPPLTPEMRQYVSAHNCANMIAWHGQLWVPHLRGLLAYQDLGDSGHALQSVGPGRGLTNENPVRGRITALAGDDNWLYAALLNNEGDTYILAGRPYNLSESSGMVWHPLIYLKNTRCDALHISGLWSSPRLFFGMNQNVGYVVLPEVGDNPLQDSNCRYADGGTIYLSAHSWNAPNTTKLWKSIEVQADNLSMLQYITVSYRIDKGRWVEAGDATLSPSTSIGLTPYGVAGKEIEVKLEFHQFNSRIPIILRTLIVRGLERPSTTDVITALIRCTDNLPLRTGGVCPRTGAEILSEIKALAVNDTAVPLIDVVGASRTVVVVPPVSERPEHDQTGKMTREMLLQVNMVVVDFEENRLTLATLFAGASDYALLIPLEVPVMLGGSTIDQSTTITSAAASRPRITIVGPLTNAVIENETTGQRIDFTGTAIGPLSFITIDMHTVSPTCLNEAGEDWSDYLVDKSVLNTFYITAGTNALRVKGDGATGATRVYLEY